MLEPSSLSPLQRYIYVMVRRSDLEADIAWEAYQAITPDNMPKPNYTNFIFQWHDCLNHKGAFKDD